MKQIRSKKYYRARKELEPTNVSNIATNLLMNLRLTKLMIRGVSLEPNYGVIIFNN